MVESHSTNLPEKAEWTCGHVAGFHCAECFGNLAWAAHVLAEELDDALSFIDGLQTPESNKTARSIRDRLRSELNDTAQKTISEGANGHTKQGKNSA